MNFHQVVFNIQINGGKPATKAHVLRLILNASALDSKSPSVQSARPVKSVYLRTMEMRSAVQ